jgi:hypothetical protein
MTKASKKKVYGHGYAGRLYETKDQAIKAAKTEARDYGCEDDQYYIYKVEQVLKPSYEVKDI